MLCWQQPFLVLDILGGKWRLKLNISRTKILTTELTRENLQYLKEQANS